MSDPIYALMITHRDGVTLTAHRTDAAATAALDRYVVSQWETEMGDDAMPDNPGERSSWYFHENGQEFYDIQELEIEEE